VQLKAEPSQLERAGPSRLERVEPSRIDSIPDRASSSSHRTEIGDGNS
jgi:hypothetical protein